MGRHRTNPSPGGDRWFWAGWAAAFLGVPIGGTAAAALLGPIETLGEAAIGGAVARAFIGVAQRLVLSQRAVEKHINAIFAKLELTPDDTVDRRVKAVLMFLNDSGSA